VKTCQVRHPLLPLIRHARSSSRLAYAATDEFCGCLTAATNVSPHSVIVGPLYLQQHIIRHTEAVMTGILTSLSSHRIERVRLGFAYGANIASMRKLPSAVDWSAIDDALSSQKQYPSLKEVMLCEMDEHKFKQMNVQVAPCKRTSVGAELLLPKTFERGVFYKAPESWVGSVYDRLYPFRA
jgi:hypothetical protein